MKSDRLISALMLLQAHGRLSTRELAERLEISQRTAHRDMESLCTAGIPLTALRGAQGGWELAKGWRTRVPGLDEAELRALLMTQPNALGDPRLIAAAERAFGKLMAAMPLSMRTQAADMRLRLHIDSTGWQPHAEDLTALPIVQDAIARDIRLSFNYTRADGDSAPRTVDPLGVVCKQSIWYLVAKAPAGLRTYRVARIANAVALSSHFKRPQNFDLAKYWTASTASLKQRPFATTLALSATAVATIVPFTPAIPIKSSAKFPVGWQVFKINFETESQAKFVVLGLGSGARVIAPSSLREHIHAEHAALLVR